MPGGDRTGPQGFGPMTGRRMGDCGSYPEKGSQARGFGRGQGRGFRRGLGRGGFGRGFGFRQNIEPVQPTKEEERRQLEQELKSLEEDQEVLNKDRESIQKKLSELKE